MAGLIFHLGDLTQRQHLLSEAWDFYEEAAEIYRKMDDDRHLATCLTRLGEILALAGFPEEARPLLEAALKTHEEGPRSDVRYDRLRLGEVFFALGRSEEAQENLAWARDGLEEHGPLYGKILLALAWLELDRENLGHAHDLASEAADKLSEAGESEMAILAEILEVRAHLLSGPLDEATQGIYNGILVQVGLDELPRAQLEAELLKIHRAPQTADFGPLLAAAETAAEKGYLHAVDTARRAMEELEKTEVANRLQTLLDDARDDWTPRTRRVSKLLEPR